MGTIFLNLFRQILGCYIKISHNCFLPHSSQFIIYIYYPAWRYINFAVQNALPNFWGLRALSMKSIIFWDVTPCSLVSCNRRFGGIYRLHLQGRRNTFSKNQQVSRCHIPEDDTLHKHRCENLKSYTALSMFKISFYTSQETHCVLIAKTNLLMEFKGMMSVYYENNIKHLKRSTLCG
jgi:hypothetical protein